MRSLRSHGWKAILLSAAIVLFVGAGTGAAVCQFVVDCGIRPDAPEVDQFAGTGGGEMRLPPGFSLTTVASDLDFPSDFDFFPDGRIVISEKEGRFSLVKGGELQSAPFLDLRSRVNSWFYRGVMNVTVDPDFPDQPYIYVVYSTRAEGANSSKPTTVRVSRFEVGGDKADLESELVILGKDGKRSCAALPPDAITWEQTSCSRPTARCSWGPETAAVWGTDA